MAELSSSRLITPENSQAEIVRQESASSALRTGSSSGRGMQILNLCRESNPSAEVLAQLLSDPCTSAGINEQDSHSKTPLIEAMARGHVHLLPLLISSGARLDHVAVIPASKTYTNETYTALHLAIASGQLDAVKLLLQSGASLHIVDHNGRSAWSLVSGEQSAQVSSSITAYIRSLSDLFNICKAPDPSLAAAASSLCDEPELRRMRLTFTSAKGFTPLHEASRRGYTDLVAFLLEQKADPNACSFAPPDETRHIQADEDSNATALHVAAANGHSRVVELLLRARADVGAVTAQGASALLLSLETDDGPYVDVVRVIVKELLDEGKVNKSRIRSIVNLADAFKCTALHTAAKRGSVPIVELLLSIKEVLVNQVNMSGQTPFHVACISGRHDVVRAFAKFKECDVNLRVQAKLRESPLHLAARCGFMDVLIELGASGAQYVTEAKDVAGKMKLFQAISNDSAERPSPIDVAQDGRVRTFLQMALDLFRLCQGEPASSSHKNIDEILAAPHTRHAFLNFRTSANNTPLHIAILSKNIRAVKEILGCYGKVSGNRIAFGYGVDCHPIVGKILLVSFATSSYAAFIDFMISFDVGQVKNDDGLSPCDLIEASYSNFDSILLSTRFNMELFDMILLDHTAPEEVTQEIAANPLSLSYKYRSKDSRLLAPGSSSSSISLCDGDTCMHVAGDIRDNHDFSSTFLVACDFITNEFLTAALGLEKILCALIAGGGDVNAKNSKGQTPLYVTMASHGAQLLTENADDECRARIASMLIDAGASVDDVDADEKHAGETALFRAAKSCRHKCIKVLVSAGARVNVVNRDGDTIFHVYRKNAHLAMQLLIDSGAAEIINQPNNREGNTALHVATMRSATGQSVALLLNSRADPTISNSDGMMPLHLACKYDKVRSIEKLLAQGVDVGVRSAKPKVAGASTTAAKESHKKKDPVQSSAKVLAMVLAQSYEDGENMLELTSHSDTPLHIACKYGASDAVRVLLNFRSPPDTLARNSDNNMPLDVSRNLDAATIRLLLSAMSQQTSDLDKIYLRCTGGRHDDFVQFEDNLTFIFSKFVKLQHLTIDNCDGLRSLPPSVSLLTSLKTIELVNCNYLRSLPDEMGSMCKLQEIKVKNCSVLEFPSAKICEGSKSTQKIQEFLRSAAGATPLRDVKVLFLGNGRSGKTSVLRMLAKMPLRPGDAGPESTRGVSVNALADKLKPGFISSVFNDVPKLMFWDFAGQLEYSAAHEYFMSNRQAVYVIIFSVVEERDCQLQQVKYWLNTVSLRHSRFNRLLLVGTKIDLVSGDLDDALERCRNDMRALVRRCCDDSTHTTDVEILFVSSLRTFPGHKEKRRALKDRLYTLCKDIFEGNEEYMRSLRFPGQYKEMLRTVEHLEQMFSEKVPIYHAWDTKGHGLGTEDIKSVKELKALYGSLFLQKKEALQVLHDTGHILLAECEQGLCVCFKPQFIADMIAIFADPSCNAFGRGKLRACATKDTILRLLVENLDFKLRSSMNAATIFNFLLSIKVIIELDATYSASLSPTSPLERKRLFMVPSALKGRPAFWREVLPQPVMCLRGLRFHSSRKIVTVGLFLRVMSSMVQNPDRMWGCAFVIEVSLSPSSSAGEVSQDFSGQISAPQSVWVFVRLYETRNVIDAIILGDTIANINTPQASAAVIDVMERLQCDASTPLTLCPFCIASDVYVRCGAAHLFALADNHASAATSGVHMSASTASPTQKQDNSSLSTVSSGLLQCSRFHTVSIANARFGLVLDSLGRNEMPPLYPVAWVTREQELAAATSTTEPALPLASSPSLALPLSMPSASRVRDRLPWQQVTSSGFALRPDGSGRALSVSFFVSTLQLAVDDIVPHESLQGLNAAIAAAAADVSAARVYEATVQSRGSMKCVNLKLNYNIVQVETPSSPSLPTKSPASTSSSEFTLEHPHTFSEGDSAMLCVTKDYDGGRCQGIVCKVSRVIDDHKVELARAEPLPACFSQQLPLAHGTALLPMVASFGPLDWVLVIFQVEEGRMKPTFSIMAGNSERFQVLPLTHDVCIAHPDEAACWREVEDNWNIVLGNDSKNYEITGVTLFRNIERERMFVEELDALATASRDASSIGSSIDANQLEIDALKQQVMGHFQEFSQKFSLLPASENKDLNLCVAWWGKSPAAYNATALNGFWKLPAHLKLDPGYFGEGFYLTRYPRYSDYYLNGLSMSKRIVDQGDILMCYSALGRPYPVTEDPFQPPDYNRPSPSSLFGQPCSPHSSCNNQGSNAHDSHYATVKLNPHSNQFFPCPLRQVPDFDEIVVFEPKRILPAAYVSFQRRRKTLLWLACDDDLEAVKSILSRMNSGEDSERSTVGTKSFSHDYCAKLEDQVDVTLFLSVSSFSRHMLANTRYKDYPSSLFRIVCSQQQYKAPDSLYDMLRSNSTWAAYAPAVLIFAPSSSQAQASHVPHNVRIATSARDCFEFASFME